MKGRKEDKGKTTPTGKVSHMWEVNSIGRGNNQDPSARDCQNSTKRGCQKFFHSPINEATGVVRDFLSSCDELRHLEKGSLNNSYKCRGQKRGKRPSERNRTSRSATMKNASLELKALLRRREENCSKHSEVRGKWTLREKI